METHNHLSNQRMFWTGDALRPLSESSVHCVSGRLNMTECLESPRDLGVFSVLILFGEFKECLG